MQRLPLFSLVAKRAETPQLVVKVNVHGMEGAVVKICVVIILLAPMIFGRSYALEQALYQLNLPHQDAVTSLNYLADKTDHGLLYSSKDLKGLVLKPIKGSYTLPDALDLLLKDTPLEAVVTDKGVIVVSMASITQQNEDVGEKIMNSSQKKMPIIAGVVAFVASSLTGGNAIAQDVKGAADDPGSHHSHGIEEIVVTAQKRGAVNVQDLAGSVQALSAKQLENNYVEGFNDYFNRVPSLSAVNQGSGQTQIVFRGVTSGRVLHADPQNRSTAGIYIDETVVTNNAFNPDIGMFDLDRIEVLRGPQGTLYGASSMSGAIRIITNAPKMNEFEAKVDLTLSNTEDGGFNNSEKVMVNIPVAEDTLAIRGMGYRIDRSGFIDNVVNGENNINDEESYGGRISALWRPSERLSLRGTVNYHTLDSDGRPDEYLPGDPYTAMVIGQTVAEELQTAKFVDEIFDDELTLANLTLKYELENHEIVSSTSYLDREFTNTLDDSIRLKFFFAPHLIADLTSDTDIEDFTQEIRIASAHDAPVNYVLGLFYQDQKKVYIGTEVVPGSDAFFGMIGIPPAAVFGAQPDTVLLEDAEINTEQTALFGEVIWQVNDQWELMAGLRWFDWRTKVDVDYAGLIARELVPLTGGKGDETGLSPKVRLRYQHNDDVMFYGVVSKGFRIGGVNSGISPTLCAADLALLGGGDATESFDSDELINYEAGIKTSWMGNSLYINISGYKIEWEDIQSQVLLPTCGFNFKDNSGDVDIWGTEVEVSAAPTDNLDLNFTASWTDGELVSDPNTLGVSTFGSVGDRVPNVPEYQASVSFSYQWPEALYGIDAFIRASVQYMSSSYSQFNADASAPNFARTPKVPSYTSGDISFGLESDGWQLSLFIKNVSDEEVVTAVDTDRLQPTTNSRARPRTVGINIRQQW